MFCCLLSLDFQRSSQYDFPTHFELRSDESLVNIPVFPFIFYCTLACRTHWTRRWTIPRPSWSSRSSCSPNAFRVNDRAVHHQGASLRVSLARRCLAGRRAGVCDGKGHLSAKVIQVYSGTLAIGYATGKFNSLLVHESMNISQTNFSAPLESMIDQGHISETVFAFVCWVMHCRWVTCCLATSSQTRRRPVPAM